MDPEGLGNGPAAFASFEALEGFPALMVVELGFTSEMGAALDGGDPALVGAS